MIHMASGAEFERGTFTTGTGSQYTVHFGKTFSKYLYFIEMTDASKTELMNSGQTSAKMFACLGIYPPTQFDNSHSAGKAFLSYRINPSNSSIDYSSNAAAQDMDETSITFGNAAITGGSNNLYREYSYNYYVAEIK